MTNNSQVDPALLKTIKDFAIIKDCSRSTIEGLITQGKIKPVKVGEQYFIDMGEYADFVVSKKIGRPATGIKVILDRLDRLDQRLEGVEKSLGGIRP